MGKLTWGLKSPHQVFSDHAGMVEWQFHLIKNILWNLPMKITNTG